MWTAGMRIHVPLKGVGPVSFLGRTGQRLDVIDVLKLISNSRSKFWNQQTMMVLCSAHHIFVYKNILDVY